jgi:hypothetical protein
VHAHRIEVLDRADDDHVVRFVAHHLELELFPADHRLFDEHAVHGREIETAQDSAAQLLDVVGDAAARTAEGERRPDHQRVSDARRELLGILGAGRVGRPRNLDADAVHAVLEELPVFRGLDGLVIRADQLHAVTFERAVFVQRDGEIDPGLASHRRQDRVGLLALDDPLQELRRERLDVGPVRELRISHDRRRVRVDEDDPVSLVFQRLAGLRSGIVELDCLPDDDGPGTDDENGMEVGPFRHWRA